MAKRKDSDPLKKAKKEIIKEAQELVKKGAAMSKNQDGILQLFEGPVGCEEDAIFVDVWVNLDNKRFPQCLNVTIGNTTLHLDPCMLDDLSEAFGMSTEKFFDHVNTLPDVDERDNDDK